MKTFFYIILILLASGYAGYYILNSKQKPLPKNNIRVTHKKVQTLTINKKQHLLTISGYGVIKPKEMVSVRAQVLGKVDFIAEDLIEGAFFKEGDLLFSIEPDDYLLRVEQAKSNIVTSQLQLRQEYAQQAIAKHEWSHIEEKIREQSEFKDLVLKEKQIEEKIAQVKAAESRLKEAELSLKRTKIFAPYDGVVLSKNISPRQLINNASELLTFASYSEFKVIASISEAELSFIHPITKDSVAKIKNITTNNIKLLPQVDNNSKMVQLLVQFNQPKNLKNFFLLNEFVQINFNAQKINAYKLSNEYIRENSIWIKTKENKLDILNIDTVIKQENFTYFTIADKDKPLQIVTGFIRSPYIGMELK